MRRAAFSAQALERRAVQGQQVLAREPLVHRQLADPELRVRSRGDGPIQELLVAEEPEARARAGVLDPLRLAREAAQQRAHHLVHERRGREVDFGCDLHELPGHPVEVGPRRVQVLGDRHQARQDRLLALLERREGPRQQQEHALEGGLGVADRVPPVLLELLERVAHRPHGRAQQRVVDLLRWREILGAHAGGEPAVEVPQPDQLSLETLPRVVGELVVVVVDTRLGRRRRLVTEGDLDELLAQGRELPGGFDHDRSGEGNGRPPARASAEACGVS